MGFVTHTPEYGEVIFETFRQKHYIKVTAHHVRSGTEVSVLCSVTATEDIQQEVALSKLDYVFRKKREGNLPFFVK